MRELLQNTVSQDPCTTDHRGGARLRAGEHPGGDAGSGVEATTSSADTDPAAPRLRPARGSILNLLGQGAPLFAAVFAAPKLVSGLGTERFGLLTIAWMLIGYFSFFDLGLSRALTQVVSERIGNGRATRAPALVWPALASILALGAVGGAVLGVVASWLVHSVLRISPALQHEALLATYLLAVGTPLVATTAGVAGILTAFHRFGTLNAIRAPLGLFTFMSPLAVLPFSNSLIYITAILVIGRLLTLIAYLLACRSVLPPFRSAFSDPDAGITPLFRFGMWMTLSNVLAPLLQHIDRLLIGAFVSVTAVAYYATPYEVVTKLLIVPSAINGALFPAFASIERSDRDRLLRLTLGGLKWVAMLLFPALLLVVAFAPEGLELWLGAEFAVHGAAVARWLAIGVFINALAQVFMTVIHAVGRPDVSARFHLLEVPIYLPLLWLSLMHYGIAGAAAIWTVRVTLDAGLLFLATNRHTGASRTEQLRVIAASLGAIACLVLPLLSGSLLVRGALVLGTLIMLVPVAWKFVLAEDERVTITARVGMGSRVSGSCRRITR